MSNTENHQQGQFSDKRRYSAYEQTIDTISLRREERRNVLMHILPAFTDMPPRILELGTGTGLITEQLVAQYPDCELVCVDASEGMLNQAKSKPSINHSGASIQWLLADYADSHWQHSLTQPFDLIVTFDALHHLSHARKYVLYTELMPLLQPNGYFFLSDLICSHEPFKTDPQFRLWALALTDKLQSVEANSETEALIKKTFALETQTLNGLTVDEVQHILIELLTQAGDNPMPLSQHLEALQQAGFANTEVLYRYAMFTIISARR